MKKSNSIGIIKIKSQENKFYSNLRSFSWILLIPTALIVTFYSSWFFLGNEEIHTELKLELTKNLFIRTVGFATLGIPTTFIITIIELVGIKNDGRKFKILLKKINLTISIILISSFIGSGIFFFR